MRFFGLILVAILFFSVNAVAQEQFRATAFFDTVVAENTCAPWDGHAVRVSLMHAGQDYPRWMISFYRFPVKTGEWLNFSGTDAGYITFCKEHNACVPALEAKVMLGVMTENEISGELQAPFEGGAPGSYASYPFSSAIISGHEICG